MRGAWRATRWKSCRTQIRLTLGLNDVLLLRNLDEVPQVFGPTIMMPGQSFRLPFERAAEYQFVCTAHASGQMTVVVEAEPATPWARIHWRVRQWLGEVRAMKKVQRVHCHRIIVLAVGGRSSGGPRWCSRRA